MIRPLFLLAASCSLVGTLLAAKPQRPNIIFIMSDDHATRAVSAYGSDLVQTPNIDRLAQEGMLFENAFCTNSICGPSRAVILTGKHSHRNGFLVNGTTQFDGRQTTFPKLLQKSGYKTALIGKWHLGSDPTGFDYWNIFLGQGKYFDPPLNEMGEVKQHQGYVTDLISEVTTHWLREQKDSDQPFLLITQHKAPHSNFQPPPRYAHSFDEVTFPEPPTLFDDFSTRSQGAIDNDMSIDPYLKLQYRHSGLDVPKQLSGKDRTRWLYQYFMRNYLGCVKAVDDAVGDLLETLDELGMADNTLVIYTSDQGFFLGEHGYYDKRLMYEPSLRQPLLARLPSQIPAGSTEERMVQNLDYAQTFLEFAGIDAPSDMQGRSLVPLMRGEQAGDWRESIYYHFYEYPGWHYVKRHNGVRTERYKLMHFYHDIDAWELYDLKQDPEEINNLYDNPEYAEVQESLTTELLRLQNHYDDPPANVQETLERFPHGSLPPWGRGSNFEAWIEEKLQSADRNEH